MKGIPINTYSRLVRSILRFLVAGLAGCLLTAVVLFVFLLNSRPDLSIWHTADLDEEFTAGSGLSTFAEYLALEERLFRQLDESVIAQVPTGQENATNRYSRGSLADPGRWPINWNRSFEMVREEPRAGVLLLHGLSDSPYTIRSLGEMLHQHGATVLGLRVPGHGTVPAGLVESSWQDMAAAVELAARHLRDSLRDKPLYLLGYSNGGALSIEYTLSALNDPTLPRVAGVILLSPEIGVSGAAALAVWQAHLGHLLGLEKLAWNSLGPEYDPFKYVSFAVNAGDLAHRITGEIQRLLGRLEVSGRLGEIPPIIAFQSAVDATVSAAALVTNLFDRLPAAGHELVLFDINRRVEVEPLLKQDPRQVFQPLLSSGQRPYHLTIISNEDTESDRVIARTSRVGEAAPAAAVQAGSWPPGVFSLSHVALPIPPHDPLYGGPQAGESPGIALGNLAPRGERGVLRISGNDSLRLRWNPFFDYLGSRITEFIGLDDS